MRLPDSTTALAEYLTRRELVLWVAGILAASQLFRVHAQPGGNLLEAFLESLASRSAFQYLGWYAVFRLLADSGPLLPASRLDTAFGLLSVLIPFLPGGASTWISITAVGLYLLVSSQSESRIKAAGVVLLALSFNGCGGRTSSISLPSRYCGPIPLWLGPRCP